MTPLWRFCTGSSSRLITAREVVCLFTSMWTCLPHAPSAEICELHISHLQCPKSRRPERAKLCNLVDEQLAFKGHTRGSSRPDHTVYRPASWRQDMKRHYHSFRDQSTRLGKDAGNDVHIRRCLRPAWSVPHRDFCQFACLYSAGKFSLAISGVYAPRSG